MCSHCRYIALSIFSEKWGLHPASLDSSSSQRRLPKDDETARSEFQGNMSEENPKSTIPIHVQFGVKFVKKMHGFVTKIPVSCVIGSNF